MTPATQVSVLAQTFSEVLANLAFLFTMATPAERTAADGWLEVGIDYEGPVHGRLRLRCPAEVGVLISANLLGCDPELEADQLNAEDAVRELMNVVCGQLVTRLHGHRVVVQLGLPVVHHLTVEEVAAPLEGTEILAVCVEGYEVQLAYACD